LGHFWHFDKFWQKKQGFPPYAPRHVALTFAGGIQIKKSLHFWIFHDKLWFLVHGQEIWASFESSRGQKHSENYLTAPILTHKKQSWEIEFLERKMTSKFINSTWVGTYTGRDFQQDFLGSIWTSGKASNSAPKWHDT